MFVVSALSGLTFCALASTSLCDLVVAVADDIAPVRAMIDISFMIVDILSLCYMF